MGLESRRPVLRRKLVWFRTKIAKATGSEVTIFWGSVGLGEKMFFWLNSQLNRPSVSFGQLSPVTSLTLQKKFDAFQSWIFPLVFFPPFSPPQLRAICEMLDRNSNLGPRILLR